jgi:hypothetical protein
MLQVVLPVNSCSLFTKQNPGTPVSADAKRSVGGGMPVCDDQGLPGRLHHGGGVKVARPLMPAINSGASPTISPITLIDWLTGSTRPPSRLTRAG